MTALGYHWQRSDSEENSGTPAAMEMGRAPGGMMGGGGGMMGGRGGPPGGMMGGGGPPGGMGGGGRGPNSKAQLATLVTKLELLSRKPLSVNLNDQQRKKIGDQLQGLDEKEELTDEDAKARLDAMLELLKDERETLEAAGYRWPGQGGGAPRLGAAPANPFKDDREKQTLKSLQQRLGKVSGV